MSKFTRARDIKVTLKDDGAPLASVHINSGSFDRGLRNETVPQTGGEDQVDQTLEAASLSLDTNPRTTAWWTIQDALAGKAKNDPAYVGKVVEAEVSIIIPGSSPQARVRYVMGDCAMAVDAMQFGGGNDRASQGATLGCSQDDLRRLE